MAKLQGNHVYLNISQPIMAESSNNENSSETYFLVFPGGDGNHLGSAGLDPHSYYCGLPKLFSSGL